MQSDARPSMMAVVTEGVFGVSTGLLSNWDLAFSRQVECSSCNMPNPSVKRNKYTFS